MNLESIITTDRKREGRYESPELTPREVSVEGGFAQSREYGVSIDSYVYDQDL